MAQQYDNTNSGALFKNTEKAEMDRPNWPDYKGSLNVAGVDYWLSAWLKKSKDGKSYMSVSVQPKEQKAQPSMKRHEPEDGIPGMDDDIPF